MLSFFNLVTKTYYYKNFSSASSKKLDGGFWMKLLKNYYPPYVILSVLYLFFIVFAFFLDSPSEVFNGLKSIILSQCLAHCLSICALFTFWVRWYIIGGGWGGSCPEHCRMFSNLPGLYLGPTCPLVSVEPVPKAHSTFGGAYKSALILI